MLLRSLAVFDFTAFKARFFPSGGHDFPAAVIRKLYYCVFDSDEDGLISFPDFVLGVSRCVHGQRRHRIRLLFDLWDVDGDGFWTHQDALSFLRASMAFVKTLAASSVEIVELKTMLQEQQFNAWQTAIRDMQQGMQTKLQSVPQQAAAEANAAAAPSAATPGVASSPPSAAAAASSSSSLSSASASASTSTAGLIPFSSFRSWAVANLRVGGLLRRFAVLPCGSEEAAEVRRLWQAHEALQPGHTWHAMSSSWWTTWKAYSGFKEPGEETENTQPTEQEQREEQEFAADTPVAAAAADGTLNGGSTPKDAVVVVGGGSRGVRSKRPTVAPSSSDPDFISDTDTDSDREQQQCASSPSHAANTAAAAAASPAAAAAAAATSAYASSGSSGSPAMTPKSKSGSGSVGRKVSQIPHSPGAIQIGLMNENTLNGSSSAAAAAVAASSSSPSPRVKGSVASAAAPLAPRPLSIDVSDLCSLRNPLLLRQPMMEHEDFVLLHQAVWDRLVEWYGLAPGPGGASGASGAGGGASADFPRQVVEVGRDGARTRRVELYPLCLRVQRVGEGAPKPLSNPAADSNPSTPVPSQGACILFAQPSATTVAMLEQRMVQLFYPDLPQPPPTPAPTVTSAAVDTPNADNAAAPSPSSAAPSSAAAATSAASSVPAPAPSAVTPSVPSSVAPSSTLVPRLRMWLRDGSDWRCLGASDMAKSLDGLDLQNDDTLLVELMHEPATLMAAIKAASASTTAAMTGAKSKDKVSKKKALPVSPAAGAATAAVVPHVWPMDSRRIPRSWHQFEVGDQIDAKDKQEIWYAAVVRKITAAPAPSKTDAAIAAIVAGVAPGAASPADAASTGVAPAPAAKTGGGSMVLVNFVGWDEKWNEYILCTLLCRCHGPCRCPGRLAPLGSQVRFKKSSSLGSGSVVVSTGLAVPGGSGLAGAPSSAAREAAPSSSSPSSASPAALIRGLSGLANVGNTCFSLFLLLFHEKAHAQQMRGLPAAPAPL